MSGGTRQPPAARRRSSVAGSVAQSFAVGMGVTVGATIVGYFVGIPEPIRQPIAFSAGFAIVMGGIHPAGTPDRWRRNLVVWSVPFAFALLASLLLNWWRGA